MPRYLVIERDVLIGRDLSAILSACVPGAEVERSGNVSEASGRLGRRIDLVFAPAGADAAALADLERAAALRGGRLVLMGGGGEADAGGLALATPFTDRSVTAFMRGIGAG